MAYLIKTRGIDSEIVKGMLQRKMIAEDSVHHNCLFFGRDENGNIRSCGQRGTTQVQFRGEVSGGDKAYTFAMNGRSNILRLFESPIDAMSHATFSKLLGKDWNEDFQQFRKIEPEGMNIRDYVRNSNSSFYYHGFHFEPIGIIPDGTTLNDLTMDTLSAKGMKYNTGYSFHDFVSANANGKSADIYRCLETNKLCLAGETELYTYTGEYIPAFHKYQINQEEPDNEDDMER